MNQPLADLSAAGVAVWLDDLSRERLVSGNLAELMASRHVVGVTTNPTIFQKALAEGDAYDEQLDELALRGVSVDEAVRLLTAYDVRWACDVLRPVHAGTGGIDGRVSLEVDPRLAHDTEATVAEAKALWWLVNRPNLFIKVPATLEGLPAITATIAQGISVNVTLIFSLQRYAAVTDAYLDGLEQAHANGLDLSTISSVASFFVSRVDTEVDNRLGADHPLRGTAAIANARLAHRHHQQLLETPRWQALAARGARPQRPLWASTGVKDPSYDDTRYVVELATAGTVNTMPEATLEAVADHGVLRGDAVSAFHDEAAAALDALRHEGIDLDDVVDVLEKEGVQKFVDSWTDLLGSVASSLGKRTA